MRESSLPIGFGLSPEHADLPLHSLNLARSPQMTFAASQKSPKLVIYPGQMHRGPSRAR